MNQSDLVPAILNLVGKEVEFHEYPGASPIVGILTKDEGMSFFEVNGGNSRARFHYLETDVLLADKNRGTKDTILRWVSEGFK